MTYGWSTWDLRLTESDVPEGPRCDFCDEPSTGTVEHGGGRFNLTCDKHAAALRAREIEAA